MAQQPQALQTGGLQIAEMPPSSYYPDPPNDLTGGLPINLDSLRDGRPGTKPFYPYSTLIRYAIKGSPNQKLLLEDIYYAIESRFPYFRTAPSGWKNSVRHNLSLNPCFVKVARPLTDRGKGSYWTVDDNVDPRTGVHRIRKKRNKNSSSQQPKETLPTDVMETFSDPQPEPSNETFFPPPPSTEQPSDIVMDPAVEAATAGPSEADVYPTFIPPVSAPEFDEHGNVNWRTAWLNELAKLQHITAEQDKLSAEPEWYREMLFRVRTAMMATIDENGVLQVAQVVPTEQLSEEVSHEAQ